MQRSQKVVAGRRERLATPPSLLTEVTTGGVGTPGAHSRRGLGGDRSNAAMSRAERSLASIQHLLQTHRELAPGDVDYLLCQLTELRLKLRLIAGVTTID